ncbi:MucBP domain-containing protein [Lactococcus lactis]|uniref:MucBP domain-containing protein n=1 Tax=Lactococcus lactis TaxID=1358 RepID=UPI0024A8F8F5|nr:MucBP domain-containing protein [Lactococcus lactis]
MIKKSSTVIALGIILFSSALPAIAETSSVIPKETTKSSESTETSHSQANTPQTVSTSTTSNSAISNEEQELHPSQEDTKKALTTTTVPNKSVVNTLDGEATASDDIASGTWGTVPWRIDSKGTLIIESGNADLLFWSKPWKDYDGQINKIDIQGKVVLPSHALYLFGQMDNLSEIIGIENLDMSNVTDMAGMFADNPKLISLDLSLLDTSNVTSMINLFMNDSSLESLNVSTWNTSNVTNMFSLFQGLTSLKDIDVSRWNTRNVTDMTNLFGDCSSLTNLDLGSWNTPNLKSMHQMFLGMLGLTSINLENWDTSQVTDMKQMFYQTGIQKLTLGSKTALNETVTLDNPQINSQYTGKWQTLGTGTELTPNGDWVGSSSELYTRSTIGVPDTYVWQPTATAAADVTVKYLDADGNEIHDAQTISGNVGDEYDASTDTYKLAIDGYTLDETKLPDNATGTMSDTAQTVTYVYSKNPVKAADVTVKYLDADGNEIHDAQTISGNVGDEYDASTDTYKLAIDGYTLDETKLPDNATGTMSDTAQTVTYVYSKNPVKAADVTVKYLDADGNEIHDAQTISGNVGDEYDASTDTYKLAIDGYTLDETKLPDNATGTMSDTAQTVTYVYTKNNVTPSPKPDDHSDTPANSKDNSNKNDSTSENKNTLPQTGDNEGLSMIGMISGLFLILGTIVMIILKRKRQD